MSYQYTSEFVRKINRTKIGGKTVSDTFLYREYNLWYFFQASLFAEVKKFSKHKVAIEYPLFTPKSLISSLLILAYTLVSCAILSLWRKRVCVFSVDSSSGKYGNDFRIEGLYAFLARYQVSFFEIFHTMPGRKTFRNIRKRQRMALYLEAIDFVLSVAWLTYPRKGMLLKDIDLSDFADGEEKKFARQLIKKYADRMVFVSKGRIKVLKVLLRLLGVSCVISIDDARNYNELLVAAEECTIPSIVLQHGHYTKYHFGFIDEGFVGRSVLPTTLLVWSEYWRKELVRLGSFIPQDRIDISGSGEVVPQSSPTSVRAQQQGMISILVPYETVAPKSELKEFMHLMKQCPNVTLLFKIRPDIPKELQVAEYDLPTDIAVVASKEHIVSDVTLVVGTYSSFLYDMVLLRKPVCILDTSMDYGEGMVINGLATKLPRENICRRIQDVAQTSEKVLEDRERLLRGSSDRVFDEVLKNYLEKYEIL